MKNIKFLGFLNALGITAYVALVALIIQNGEKIFGKMNNFFGPVAFLLLFVLSAAITGSLALGRPVMLYLENKKSQAVKLFLYTLLWLFAITLAVFVILILT